jgi:hypothetical protein
MLSIHLNKMLIVDGSGFINIYNENRPIFNFEKIKSSLIPKVVDDNYFTCWGYKINVKSTIFKDAKSNDLMKGWNMIINSIEDEDIFESFFELEIYNYCRILNGFDAYLFPALELLKLCYWFYMCSEILESRSKLLQIKKEILGKSQVIKKYSKASESSEAYDDLLNTISDFRSEMMFAVLSHKNGHNVSLNKRNDFVIDNNIAEVKSIHDKFDKKILDKDSNLILKLSLHDHFSYDDVKDIIYNQITRKKWIYHLNKAIKKQKGKIILFNVTESQKLQRISIFLEDKGLRKSFDYMLNRSLVDNCDSIPVLVTLESIHQYHIMSFFCFLAPVKYENSNPELDLSRYTTKYLKDNIFL